MGDYGVSIIYINSSTIAISIVEPQNDADTFINSCGKTGERPAIRVMITIHDARATVRLADVDEEVRNITIDVTYSDDEDGFNFDKIILALAKQKVDDLIKDSAKKSLLDEFIHRKNVKVYNGLLEFASNSMLITAPFRDVIRSATRAANGRDMSVIEYLAELGKDCIGDDEI